MRHKTSLDQKSLSLVKNLIAAQLPPRVHFLTTATDLFIIVIIVLFAFSNLIEPANVLTHIYRLISYNTMGLKNRYVLIGVICR